MLILALVILCAKCDCNELPTESNNEISSSSSISSTNSGEEQNNQASEINDLQDAMTKGQEALKQFQGEDANIRPANFRKIKEKTPEKVAGLTRVKMKGSSGGFGNYMVSTVESEFRSKDGNKWMKSKVIDAGGIGKTALGMSFASWSMIHLDEEGDDYFKRTSTMGSFKTYEECNTTRKRCELKLYSPDGVIAEFEGYNVSIADLKKAVKKFGLEKIPGMRESN